MKFDGVQAQDYESAPASAGSKKRNCIIYTLGSYLFNDWSTLAWLKFGFYHFCVSYKCLNDKKLEHLNFSEPFSKGY